MYDLGPNRKAADDHQIRDDLASWKSREIIDHGGLEDNRVPMGSPNSKSPQTPSMFYENHWITQSTLFPFPFHDFEKRQQAEGVEGESTENQKSQLQCATCKAKFDTRNALEEHAKTHSNTNRNYTCNFCNKSFSRSWNFQRHILIHKGKIKCLSHTLSNCIAKTSWRYLT